MNETTRNKTKLNTTKTLLIDDEDEDQDVDQEEKYRLKALKFPSCMINKPSSQKFILKNLSGIKTTFNFRAIEYEPDNMVLPANIQGKSSLEDLPRQDLDETLTLSKPGSKSSKRETKIRFALTNKSKKGLNIKQLKRALLTDSHEHMNKFQSKTGETFTATKRLEREQSFYLSNNKGLAIVLNPSYGELLPHAEIPIDVTIYNNACGRFEDTLISEIKGLPPFKFPIYASINGSPLIIPENQVGLNYFTNPPTLAFPTVVDNSPQLMKTFKITNTGIADVVIDWNLYDQKDQNERNKEDDLFKITIDKNTGFDSEENPYKLKFDLIEPEPSVNSPFSIEPQRAVIPARETQFFEVRFNSGQGVDTFKCVVLAHPQLAEDLESEMAEQHPDEVNHKVQELPARAHQTMDLYDYNSDSSADREEEEARMTHQPSVDRDLHDDEEPHKWENDSQNDPSQNAKRDLGIVALKLYAKTIEPVLSVDMKEKLDSEYYFNFYQWPMNHEDEPSDIEKVCLVNETKANLIFNLETEGPFKIISTKTNSGSVHPLAPTKASSKKINNEPMKMFSLQPDKIVQMKIKYSPPDPTNHMEWPLVKAYIKKGLINVAFANGKHQSFNLLGNLVRPNVCVKTEKSCKNEKGVIEIDLGEVNTESFRQAHFYLINETGVPAKWALNYVKFPNKSNLGYMTKTPLEIENMNKTDDPEVFQFSVTEVRINYSYNLGMFERTKCSTKSYTRRFSPSINSNELSGG